MSRIDELAKRYADHIAVPWQQGLPAANRVVMLVYEKELERHLRAKLLEFEQATKTAGHGWQLVDLTTAFAEWMGGMKYREEYFERPDDIRLKLDSSFLRHVSDLIKAQLSQATDNDVVALLGAGSLFGFLRLSEARPAPASCAPSPAPSNGPKIAARSRCAPKRSFPGSGAGKRTNQPWLAILALRSLTRRLQATASTATAVMICTTAGRLRKLQGQSTLEGNLERYKDANRLS